MKKWLNHLRTVKTRRGQAMVEFALAFPIFLMLVLGVMEFGRMFLMYTSVFAGAREGARYGAAVETVCDSSGIHNAVRRAGFFAGDINIGVQYDDGYGNLKACENTVLGDRVHVTAEITFESITGVIPDLTLRSTARRTLIKRAFLQWTLQPPGEVAGGVPPAVTFGPSDDEDAPEGSATVTTEVPPEESETVTTEPSDTTTPEPTPSLCSGVWNYQPALGEKIYYYLDITNNSDVVRQLTKIEVSWNDQGGRQLEAVHYSPPQWVPVLESIDSDSPFTHFLPTPPLIGIGETITLRFTFSNNDNDELTGVKLFFGASGLDCYLQYIPPAE